MPTCIVVYDKLVLWILKPRCEVPTASYKKLCAGWVGIPRTTLGRPPPTHRCHSPISARCNWCQSNRFSAVNCALRRRKGRVPESLKPALTPGSNVEGRMLYTTPGSNIISTTRSRVSAKPSDEPNAIPVDFNVFSSVFFRTRRPFVPLRT